jgi:large subunit ribosomal protein L17
MGHNVVKHGFGRKMSARAALFKGLVSSLVEHGRIRTTLAKAKEIRKHADRAVTLGKKGDLNSRRLLISRTGSADAADKLIGDIGKRFAKRAGGYTRVIKAGLRPGDMAPMAILEFVDYEAPAAGNKETEVKGDKNLKKRQRAATRVKAHAVKNRREIQIANRRLNRA